MTADHKAVVERFETALAANDVPTIDELCDANLVDHNPVPGQEPGLAGFKATMASYKAIFPDLKVDLYEVLVDGDSVATRWAVTGTHQAEFFGVPATGKQLTVEGMNFYHVDDGKITDVWTQFDGVSILQQLGVLSDEAE